MNGLEYLTALNGVLAQLDMNYHCTVLTSATTIENTGQVLGDNPNVLTNWDNPLSLKRSLDVLRHRTSCVISVIQSNSTGRGLKELMTNPVAIDKHYTIYISVDGPGQDLLTKINRQLIWINGDQMSKNQQIQIFCPKIGKPPKSQLKHLTLFSNKFYNQKTGHLVILRMTCSNPLKGQVITFAAIPVRPQFHPPNTVGNSKLSGYTVNLFFQYAKYFKFKPQIYPSGQGSFIPHNKTFSPGALNDVSSTMCFYKQFSQVVTSCFYLICS